jgi:Uma2 family endonuclease
MATAVQLPISPRGYHLRPNELYIPVEEYLRTTYRPDMEYIDGHLEDRNVGEAEHSRLLQILGMMLGVREEEWNILTYPDCRLQVNEDRYRVPDLLVLPADQPAHRVVRTAPLLCVEVLSPEDTLKRILIRVEDYVEMGVRSIWIFNPDSEEVLVCVDGEKRWTDEQKLTVPGTAIQIDREELFRRFKRSLAQPQQ